MWAVIRPVQAVTDSDSEATAQCELLLTAKNRNILTYLLTYKQDRLHNLANFERILHKQWTNWSDLLANLPTACSASTTGDLHHRWPVVDALHAVGRLHPC